MPAVRTSLAGAAGSDRSAFTLIEMLVTIGIMLILSVVTLTTVSITMSKDRVRSAARQVQSYLEGARDRAIFARQPRGVRFLLDQTNQSGSPMIKSMVYIGPMDPATGTLDISADSNGNMTVITQTGGVFSWQTLAQRGTLAVPARIRISRGPGLPADGGQWYQIDPGSLPPQLNAQGQPTMTLLTPHLEVKTPTSGLNYELQLAPAVLPNQDPVLLPQGVVIDAVNSQLPAWWGSNTGYMDILFSPRGSVTGPASSNGLIHFLLADLVDVTNGLGPGNPNKEGDEVIVSLFTRTGHASTSPVYTSNPNDPFYYAETGAEAK